jgi:hypothetical protein
MKIISGVWAASIVDAASRHGIFSAQDRNPSTADNVAKKTGISCGIQCASGSGRN